jgi:predicted metal-binding protein
MKKIITSFLAVLLIASFCGCSTENSNNMSALSNLSSEIQGEENQKTDSKETVLLHSKVSETWDSGVVVNANLTSIDSEALPTYSGVMQTFKTDDLLGPLGISTDNAIASGKGQATYLVTGETEYFEFTDERYFSNNLSNFGYHTKLLDKVNNILIFDGSKTNTETFSTGKNLDFETLDKVKSKIQEILHELNITVINEPVCCTMDYETMSAESERQYEAAVEDGSLYQKQNISKDDECYVFYYLFSLEGMPVSPFYSGVYGKSPMTGTSLKICYDKNGIEGVEFAYCPIANKISEAKPVISADDIIQKEKEKYDTIILDGSYTIYDIRLEYIPQLVVSPFENSYNFIPVWRFSVEHSYILGKEGGTKKPFQVSETVYDVYDALTGEQILTSNKSSNT